MPPQGAPQPDAARRAHSSPVSTTLDRAARQAHPNPGRPLLHRLNRAEYANAIRDLLALDVDPSSLLPPDDSAYGFDNIADVLGCRRCCSSGIWRPPTRSARWPSAIPRLSPAGETFRIRQDASQDTHIEGLPIGTVGGILAKHAAARRRVYVLRFELFRTNLGVMRGLEYAHELEYTVDGARVHLPDRRRRRFQGQPRNMTKAGDDVESARRMSAAAQGRPARHHCRVPRAERPPRTRCGCSRSSAARPTRSTPSGIRISTRSRSPGPFNATGPGDTPSRRKNLHVPACASVDRRRVRAADHRDARAPRLSRRTVRADIDRLLEFYQSRPEAAARSNRHPDGAAAHSRQPEVLLPRRARPCRSRAGHGLSRQRSRARLAPVVLPLEQHSRRSTARSVASAGHAAHAGGARTSRCGACWPTRRPRRSSTNFAGQWLYLRNLKNLQPNSDEFPDFDDNLRQALQRETELFFGASCAKTATSST